MVNTLALDSTGTVIGTRDENGVWEQTPAGENVAALDSMMPHWREAEVESGMREAGTLITDADLPVADWDVAPIANWGLFLALAQF